MGVPIASGILSGLHLICFWRAVAGSLAVVALDVVFDETRGDDALFFVVLPLSWSGSWCWLIGSRARSCAAASRHSLPPPLRRRVPIGGLADGGLGQGLATCEA